MCGILAHINTPSVDDSIIKKQLLNRGKDGYSSYSDSFVKLYHSLLSITDDKAIQPFKCQNLILVFSGEIYNHKKLRSQFLSTKVFDNESDTETIIKGFQAIGSSFLSHMEGMFALLIYDTEKKEIIISRDSYGIKPLFFSQSEHGISFSSSVTLLDKSSLDNHAYTHYINYGWGIDNETPYENIKAVPPNSLWVYQIKTNTLQKEFLKESNYKIGFKEALIESIKEQTNSPHKTGILFSGGIDSTLLALYSKKLGLDLPLYTFDFAGNQKKYGYSEDLDYAKKIAKQLNLKLTIVQYSESDFRKYIERTKKFSEPILDLAGFSLNQLCEKAKGDDVKILLSGLGPDEQYGGYRRHSFAKSLDFLPSSLNEFILNWMISRKLSLNKTLLNKLHKKHHQSKLSKEVLHFDQTEYLTNNNLRYAENIGLFNNIEIRVPYLSSKLKYLSNSLTLNSKKLLTDLLIQDFSKDLIFRKKTGFALPSQVFKINTKEYRELILNQWIKENAQPFS